MIGIPITALLHVMVVIGLGLRILYRQLAVNTTLAWILLIASIPVVGAGIYYYFGDHRMGRRRLRLGPRIRRFYQNAYDIDADDVHTSDMEVSPFFEDLSQVVAEETGFYPSVGNQIKLLSDPDTIFQSLIADIDNAKSTCFLEFYIIEDKGRVLDILDAVSRAKARGVDCRILADGFGSKRFLRGTSAKRLQAEGIIIETSLPTGILKSFSKRTDLRNHRKIVVIDQKIGYLGSFNLADPKEFKSGAGVGEWVDVFVRLQGHIVSSLAVVFNTDYIFDCVGADFNRSDLRTLPMETTPKDYARDAVLQLVPSGPEMRTSLIYEVIVSAIFGARNSITIVTPYFVPDEAIILALTNASRRGLDVTLILPKKIDSRMARYAGQSVFEQLLDSGITILRYRSGMLHTKAILIDDDICFLGTVNMDMRSFYLNLEITMAVYDKAFLTTLRKVVDGYREECELVTAERWAKRSRGTKLKENILRLATPLL